MAITYLNNNRFFSVNRTETGGAFGNLQIKENLVLNLEIA